MKNNEIEKAIHWHGCKKVSIGYKSYFVYKKDYGDITRKSHSIQAELEAELSQPTPR